MTQKTVEVPVDLLAALEEFSQAVRERREEEYPSHRTRKRLELSEGRLVRVLSRYELSAISS